MLSKMSSQTGACANYNVGLPTEIQIIKGEYCSVSKLLESMRSIFKYNLLEMKIKAIRDIPTQDEDQNPTSFRDQSRVKTDVGGRRGLGEEDQV